MVKVEHNQGIASGYKAMLSQWGYKTVNPDGTLDTFNPDLVKYISSMGLRDECDNCHIYTFKGNQVSYHCIDCYGRDITKHDVGYVSINTVIPNRYLN